MSWVATGVMTAAAIANQVSQAKMAAKRNRDQAKQIAAQTAFSPWTGIAPSQANPEPVNNNVLGAAVEGGLAGYMQGQNMQKAGGGDGSMGSMLAKQKELEDLRLANAQSNQASYADMMNVGRT